MPIVITFESYRPPKRADSLPWTQARIEEAETADAEDIDWTVIDTVNLNPLDADPLEPMYRTLTTELGSAADLWYRIVFVDGTGDTAIPTAPVQNISSAVGLYVTVDELARILKIRQPTDDQRVAMERVLLTAAGEINSEVDLAEGESLDGWQLALAAEVNLERGAELWKLQEVQFGVLTGSEFGPVHIARNSWDKHAYTLAPLKGQWGLA